ncbi:DUF4381 domain-containing protein [Shewanella gaetbuli]|uniref:DUF4381 domain-containing protein n=1 Tax=Shewanella gaetbuli TaxID=220752 RepID=A0A9X1ZFV7_9GAMM|nr:DUF4381 domain-containing protein [Shewanella gaetbuli]MCL1141609.1 DUF4381 domain-containing protein [Shewanella gaetbuli]
MLTLSTFIIMAAAPSATATAPIVTPAPSPLEQMHDIALPETVSSLPIAPGYWILLAAILIVFTALLAKWLKHKKYHAPRKAALKLLTEMDVQSASFAADVNSLLKRTALTYLPRASLAHLNGTPWFNWLDRRLPTNKQNLIGDLLVKRYQASGLTPEENQQLFSLASLWLNNKDKFEHVAITTTQQGISEVAC